MLNRKFKQFWQDESGATVIEYGLIASLVSVAAITSMGLLGTALADVFGGVASALNPVGELDNPVKAEAAALTQG